MRKAVLQFLAIARLGHFVLAQNMDHDMKCLGKRSPGKLCRQTCKA